MRLCIDASNLRAGGGITHLHEMLRNATPERFGFEKVFVWASQKTLDAIEDRPWLVKRTCITLEQNYLRRGVWQKWQLGRLVERDGCNLLFVPGGSFATRFRPVVTMSRNMIPFEPQEMRRFGFSFMRLKMLLVRWTQPVSMRQASGVIFLNRYAHETSMLTIGRLSGKVAIVPHGVDIRFCLPVKRQLPLSSNSAAKPFRLIYVSTVDVYKHHVEVIDAVASLRSKGMPISLELIGSAYAPALKKVNAALKRVDPAGDYIRYRGPIKYAELNTCYAQADAAIFASSCENMPNILLEKMTAGLPIACARKGPMPEMLGDAGLYFDPDDSDSIAECLADLLSSPVRREQMAHLAQQRAAAYSWARCAHETFSFLSEIATESQGDALAAACAR
jgi:glycosyltransferase involved in cell wall biosynthesis